MGMEAIIYERSGLLGVAVFLILVAGYRWFDQRTAQQMQRATAEDRRDSLMTEAFVRFAERGQVESEATRKLAYTLSIELLGMKGVFEQGFKDLRADIEALKAIVIESVKGDPP